MVTGDTGIFPPPPEHWIIGGDGMVMVCNKLRTMEKCILPLSLARAKARRFDAAARRRAGLGEDFIEAVRSARSTQEIGLPPGLPDPGKASE